MTTHEERRNARRARVPGVQLTYESASGAVVAAEVLDLSTGGAFLRSAAPVPVGHRLSLELAFAGAPSCSALGRVVWTRPSDTADGPAGMGVKFIDADDELVALIARLVSASPERTDPGMGAGAAPPVRERTMLGIGVLAASPEVAAVDPHPIVSVGPRRERTMLGMGSAALPAGLDVLDTDRSVAIDLVTKREPEVRSDKPARAPPPELEVRQGPDERAETSSQRAPATADDKPFSDRSLAAAGVPRRRWGVWLVLLLLVSAGAGAYHFRARIPLQRLRYYVETHLHRQ